VSGHDALRPDAVAKRLIERLLDGGCAFLGRLCKSAYFHNNGFAMLRLAVYPDGSMLRLHYWPSGEVRNANVHSHRWDMSSYILKGSYRARNYVESEQGIYCDKYYCPEGKDGKYEFDLIGPAWLRVVTDRVYTAGDRYDMSAGLVHSVDEILTSELISLVSCSPARLECSWVYPPNGTSPCDITPKPVDAELLRLILAQAHQELCSRSYP
jgi:hypothetical protein